MFFQLNKTDKLNDCNEIDNWVRVPTFYGYGFARVAPILPCLKMHQHLKP